MDHVSWRRPLWVYAAPDGVDQFWCTARFIYRWALDRAVRRRMLLGEGSPEHIIPGRRSLRGELFQKLPAPRNFVLRRSAPHGAGGSKEPFFSQELVAAGPALLLDISYDVPRILLQKEKRSRQKLSRRAGRRTTVSRSLNKFQMFKQY